MNVTIVTIGDELLIGQVIDTNSAWMGAELNKIGITVRSKIAAADDEQEIISSLNDAKSKSDIVLITGGLGPTKDDITKHTLCKYFGSNLIRNEEILQMVLAIFKKLNRPIIESNLKQADVPDNCTPIKNFQGTAPGMWFEQDSKIFISMPGVPYEMKSMMRDFVLPKLAEKNNGQHIIHKTILTQGLGESFIAEKISDIENNFPKGFKLAYLPHYSIVRLRITAIGSDGVYLKSESKKLQQQIESRIDEYIWGYDDDTMEKVVGRVLLERKATLSIAESCTGGNIAHLITSLPGSSDYFTGSVVSYTEDVKRHLLGVKEETIKQFGVVSEQTAKEMAAGALKILKSDYAIAVTGVAGPSGGTETNPVGTVWVAVGNAQVIACKRFQFLGERSRIIELASINALAMLLRVLRGTLA